MRLFNIRYSEVMHEWQVYQDGREIAAFPESQMSAFVYGGMEALDPTSGATLTPPPRELARDALVAAALEVRHAQENWDNGFSNAETTSETIEDLHNACTTAFNSLSDATAAYLAALSQVAA